jgi:hypothetical protein
MYVFKNVYSRFSFAVAYGQNWQSRTYKGSLFHTLSELGGAEWMDERLNGQEILKMRELTKTL